MPAGVIGLRARASSPRPTTRTCASRRQGGDETGEARVLFVLPDFDGLEPRPARGHQDRDRGRGKNRGAWTKLGFVTASTGSRRPRGCSPGRCPASSRSTRWTGSTTPGSGSPADSGAYPDPPGLTYRQGPRMGRRGVLAVLLAVVGALVVAPAAGAATQTIQFLPTGSMSTPRYSDYAAPLADGRVLVGGGYDPESSSPRRSSTRPPGPSARGRTCRSRACPRSRPCCRMAGCWSRVARTRRPRRSTTRRPRRFRRWPRCGTLARGRRRPAFRTGASWSRRLQRLDLTCRRLRSTIRYDQLAARRRRWGQSERSGRAPLRDGRVLIVGGTPA